MKQNKSTRSCLFIFLNGGRKVLEPPRQKIEKDGKDWKEYKCAFFLPYKKLLNRARFFFFKKKKCLSSGRLPNFSAAIQKKKVERLFFIFLLILFNPFNLGSPQTFLQPFRKCKNRKLFFQFFQKIFLIFLIWAAPKAFCCLSKNRTFFHTKNNYLVYLVHPF